MRHAGGMDDGLLGDRWRGALLGTGLGDAVGRPFEGDAHVEPARVDAWLDSSEQLTWTDDTAMTIALSRSLIAQQGGVDPEHLGDAFAVAYRREPWRGYGAGPPQVFAAAAEGTPYVEAARELFDGAGSFGNGAAMRAAPVAVAGHDDPQRVAWLARAQAAVTHAHPLAQDGAALLALSVWAVAAEPQQSARDAVADQLGLLDTDEMRQAATDALDLDADTIATRFGNGIAALEAVPAALAAFLHAPEEPLVVLATAVGLGGDTDTIAAMAGALVGARVGARALPRPLLDRLEGREELIDLADTLARVTAS
jgi:poly(ADP-ribose) glycohydrolase ARH3